MCFLELGTSAETHTQTNYARYCFLLTFLETNSAGADGAPVAGDVNVHAAGARASRLLDLRLDEVAAVGGRSGAEVDGGGAGGGSVGRRVALAQHLRVERMSAARAQASVTRLCVQKRAMGVPRQNVVMTNKFETTTYTNSTATSVSIKRSTITV